MYPLNSVAEKWENENGAQCPLPGASIGNTCGVNIRYIAGRYRGTFVSKITVRSFANGMGEAIVVVK